MFLAVICVILAIFIFIFGIGALYEAFDKRSKECLLAALISFILGFLLLWESKEFRTNSQTNETITTEEAYDQAYQFPIRTVDGDLVICSMDITYTLKKNEYAKADLYVSSVNKYVKEICRADSYKIVSSHRKNQIDVYSKDVANEIRESILNDLRYDEQVSVNNISLTFD